MTMLTATLKKHIDEQDYESLLRRWRFSPCGDELFIGESGEYYKKRMNELRARDPHEAALASKRIGWKCR